MFLLASFTNIFEYMKIYQSVNTQFNLDEEFAKDICYWDIPTVYSSLFIMARKLILKVKK